MTAIKSQDMTKRRYPRRDFRRQIGVLVEGAYFLAQGLEVGEGGIAIHVDEKALQKLAVGKCAVLTFKMPGGHFISVRAEVRNDVPVGGAQAVGCSFHNLAFEARREIRSFVSARSEYGND